MKWARALLALFTLTYTAGCGDDGSSTPADGGGGDAAVDSGPATCDESELLTFEIGDADGHAEPLGAGATEARAGRIDAEQLPPDPHDLMAWEAGDFVLANDRIAVLIEDAGASHGYDPYGGKIVGVFLVEDGALVHPADFNEVLVTTGPFTFEPDSVTVLEDGTDGGGAVVRAVGVLAPMSFIDHLIGPLLRGGEAGLPVAVDYRLEPGAEHVDITFHWIWPNPSRPDRIFQLAHVFMQFEWMPAWAPGFGFAFDPSDGATPYVAFVDEDDLDASYIWSSPGATLEPALEISGVSAFLTQLADTALGIPILPPCSLTELDAVRLYVGKGLDGVLAAHARTEGIDQRAITATVLEAAGTAADGVRVHATAVDGTHLTRAVVGADGTAVLHVPADQEVDLWAWRQGDPVAGPVRVAVDASAVELAMAERSFVQVRVTDAATGAALPVRVQVQTAERPTVPGSFGETLGPRGRLHMDYAIDGDITFPVPAGTHRVIVSRGYEYELASADVTVTAGETAAVDVALERVVDTTDVMCGDFHIHTRRSPDAEDHAELKLAGAMADGLEIPVRTDHDWVYQFEDTIAEMGAEELLYGVTGLELTTFTYGHFGVFPLEPQPDQLNHGAFRWYDKDPSELFAEARGRVTAHGMPALIVNHPRGFSGGAIGSYFEAAQYDAETGMVGRPELWDETFRLVEVFNDSDFDENYDPTHEAASSVADWFSFLNAGRRVYAVGSSDSHHIRTSPVGYPRTCIHLGTDDPVALRAMGAGHIRDTMLAGDFTVSGGIYVDALAAGGVRPGGEVTGASATELVDVTVQAASWIDADTLRVYVDGTLVETIALDATTEDPLNPVIRFQDQVSVPVVEGAAGSWVVFVASGEQSLEPVHDGRMPFGVTNPIFFRR